MSWQNRFKLVKRRISSNSNDNINNNRASEKPPSLDNITNTLDNLTIMDHSHSEDQLWGAVEIIPQRLYYAPLKFFPPERDDDEDEDSDNDDGERQQQQKPTNNNNKPIHYFSIDNELLYWNFFLDYGPLNLGQLHRFCSKLNAKLSSPEYKDCIICYYSGAKGEARSNATFMICAWSMLYLGRSLEESYFGFEEEFGYEGGSGGGYGGGRGSRRMENASSPPQLRARRSSGSSSGSSSSGGRSGRGDDNNKSYYRHPSPSPFARIHPLPPFHDASPIACTYDLTVHDCLQGLDKARQFGFFKFGNAVPYQDVSETIAGGNDPDSKPSAVPARRPRNPSAFNVDEYEYFEQVENGDLNWIVQNKILAFAGPQAQKVVTPEGFCMLTPADYIPYFLKTNVKLVVRLNKRCYDETDFEKVGIHHVEHYYLDGSCPPMSILHDVVSDMESLEIDDNAAMAVHCKAGLGRTGTCIGAYLMKHYRLSANEVIGWMRICRPGMVIGPQQHFLADIEGLMWQEGESSRSLRVHALESGGGSGLRRMSIGSGSGSDAEIDSRDGEEAEDSKPAASVASAAASPTPILLSTPRKETPRQSRTPASATGGAHVSIVTPDGQPLHLPTTPVVARKLDLKADTNMMPRELLPESKQQKQGIHSTPSSTSSLPTMDALKVDQAAVDGSSVMQEGDQANALLSRRLDQFQARQNKS